MKFLSISLVSFLYFSTICFARTIIPEDRQCAIDHGVPDLKFEDICYKMFCSPEEPSKKFKEFIFCSLTISHQMNEAGDIINEKTKELFKDITKGEDTLDYVYTIGKSLLSTRGKQTPLHCKGELSDVWNICKKLYGYPKINYLDTITIIYGDEEPKENFKEFLLCGLKQENILTSEGTLDEESLSKTLFGKKILKQFSENPQPKDKAEFAYHIANTWSVKPQVANVPHS